ncbi:MAG: class I tRNA ligase family protein, partial [Acidobacteria bacterium]|nr:class I tRNA ligase family protein [Acidobacteriota bacterium]
VLYATEWDAFGLPNELAALQAGTSPPEFARHWIRTMEEQLRRLGISYDWSRVHSTADPSYYRWTQWLFVELFERGFVKRRSAILAWCPRCTTTLSRMQSVGGVCWRCGGRVERRRFPQWFVLTSRFARRLDAGLGHLEQWSATSKRLLRAFLRSDAGADGRASGGGDWLVSRQRAWGTPIPIVHCDTCGPVPVPRSLLPVRLPEDLDWSLGSAALASHPSFAATVCPRCTRPARRETDTLDCFFDDIWCFLSCLSPLGPEFDLGAPDVRAWMPVDRFHSGLDTFHYLHLHRFLGLLLDEWNVLPGPEPIRSYMGHEMVLSGKRKMSTHLGNTVSPDGPLDRPGADAVRVAVLWAAGPLRPMVWSNERLERAAAFLDTVHRLNTQWTSVPRAVRGIAIGGLPSRAARSLAGEVMRAMTRVGKFIEEYRPNAAVEEMAQVAVRLDTFVGRRVSTGRLRSADVEELAGALRDYAIALSPFAPHLAEEIGRLHEAGSLICLRRWPHPVAADGSLSLLNIPSDAQGRSSRSIQRE